MIQLQNALNHPAAKAVVLFGSHARGDADNQSDIDVAVFVDAMDIDTLSDVKAKFVANAECQQLVLSVYSTKTAEVLASDGSLFLWHLNLEGKVLLQRNGWLSSLFTRLAPYGKSKALRDVKTFDRVICDVQRSLKIGESTLLFEAATMFSVLRNLGMIYSHMVGIPCFGRSKPIRILAQGMGVRFPFRASEICILENFRLAYTRHSISLVRNPEAGWCRAAAYKTAKVVEFLEEVIDAG